MMVVGSRPRSLSGITMVWTAMQSSQRIGDCRVSTFIELGRPFFDLWQKFECCFDFHK